MASEINKILEMTNVIQAGYSTLAYGTQTRTTSKQIRKLNCGLENVHMQKNKLYFIETKTIKYRGDRYDAN